MEQFLLLCLSYISAVLLFLFGCVVAASWIAGCLFMLNNHHIMFGVLAFVLPPIAIAYTLYVLVQERAAERRYHQLNRS